MQLARRIDLSHLRPLTRGVRREFGRAEKERSSGSVVAESSRLLGGPVERLRGRFVSLENRTGDVMAALDRVHAHCRQQRVDPPPLIGQRQLIRRRGEQRVREGYARAGELDARRQRSPIPGRYVRRPL